MQNRHEEPKQAITVLGDKWHGFELYRWREAIMCFLDLVWSGKYNYGAPLSNRHAQELRALGAGNVILRIRTSQHLRVPKSNTFADLSLVFTSLDQRGYGATGGADQLDFSKIDNVLKRGHHLSEISRGEFESLLARFARNKNVKGLILPLPDTQHAHTLGFVSEHGRLLVGIQSPS